MMEIIRSNKGGEKLCYLGYLYTKKSASSSAKRWECSRRKALSCNGKISTDMGVQNVISTTEHNHAPDTSAVEAEKVRQSLKQRAVAHQGNTTQILLDSMSEMTEEGRQALGNLTSVKRTIRRHRQKALTKDPSSLKELQIEGDWTMTGGPDPRPFLIHDSGTEASNRVIVFATEEALRFLAESTTWFMDADFIHVPPLFKQVFIIRAPLGENVVRLVYAFLSSNSEDLYEEMLTAVVNKTHELECCLNVRTITADFDQAVTRAISNKMGPSINLKTCFYHLIHSLGRMITFFALDERCFKDERIKQCCGMLAGLAFLPVDVVSDGMEYIKSISPDELKELIDDFDATYVTGVYSCRTGHRRKNLDPSAAVLRRTPPLFPPEKWNFHQTALNNQWPTCWSLGYGRLAFASHDTVRSTIKIFRKDAANVTADLTLDSLRNPVGKRPRLESSDLETRISILCWEFTQHDKTLGETLSDLSKLIRY